MVSFRFRSSEPDIRTASTGLTQVSPQHRTKGGEIDAFSIFVWGNCSGETILGKLSMIARCIFGSRHDWPLTAGDGSYDQQRLGAFRNRVGQ